MNDIGNHIVPHSLCMIMEASNQWVRSEVSHFVLGRKLNVNFIDNKLKTEKSSYYNPSCKHNGHKIQTIIFKGINFTWRFREGDCSEGLVGGLRRKWLWFTLYWFTSGPLIKQLVKLNIKADMNIWNSASLTFFGRSHNGLYTLKQLHI